MRISITYAVLLMLVSSTAIADEPSENSARRPAVLFESPSVGASDPGAAETVKHGSSTESVRHTSDEETVVVTEGLHSLRWLVGTWRFQQPDGEGQAGTAGVVTTRVGPGGHSLIVETTIAAGPEKGLSIHEIIVPASGRGFEVYIFASNADVPVITEAFFDDRTLTWSRELEVDGAHVSTEVAFERVTTRRTRLTMESVTSGRRSANTLRVDLMKRS